MLADPQVQQEVIATLDAYAAAYAAKDVEGLLALMVPDADILFIGTGVDEWVEGQEALRRGFERDLEQALSVRLDFRNVKMSAAGPAAWLACLLRFHVTSDGEEIDLEGRFTATFERRHGKWLFAQAHYSVPAGDQEAGQSYPTAR